MLNEKRLLKEYEVSIDPLHVDPSIEYEVEIYHPVLRFLHNVKVELVKRSLTLC